MSFKKFGIWGNTEKEIFWKILPEILSWAEKNKIKPFLTKRISFLAINSCSAISGGLETFFSCSFFFGLVDPGSAETSPPQKKPCLFGPI